MSRGKIRRVEGFRVRILHLRGSDVRGDRTGLPQYSYHRAADGDFTVEQWKATRFRSSFPGFEVDVMDRRGNSSTRKHETDDCPGQLPQEEVRQTKRVNG